MKKHLFYLSMALITALFSACGNGKKGVFTPTSSGRAYEILVVIDQGLWERPAGRTSKRYLAFLCSLSKVSPVISIPSSCAIAGI